MPPTATTAPSASPPKRMTRARAKAADEKSKTTIVTTPAARAALKNKRKITESGEVEGGLEQLLPPQSLPSVEEARTLPVKSSLKPTKSKDSTSDEQKQQPMKPTRGRPRKTPVLATATTAEKAKSTAVQATRGIRARVAPAVKASTLQTDALKKKVTFEAPEEDKENVVVLDAVTTDKGSQAAKPQGFKAKPTRAIAASRKGGAAQHAREITNAAPSVILDKSDQAAPVLESSGASKIQATPLRHLSKTPLKFSVARTPANPSATQETGADLVETQAPEQQVSHELGPHKEEETIILKSPAKRPPPSPFKNAMKESPKRMGSKPATMENAQTDVDTQASELPLLQKSPKKFNITQDSTGAVFKIPPKPAFKASMFTSPARRPPTPLKGYLAGTPYKPEAAASIMSAMTAGGLPKTPSRFNGMTGESVNISLKISRSPEASTRVHKISVNEQKNLPGKDLCNGPAALPQKKLKTTTPVSSAKRSSPPKPATMTEVQEACTLRLADQVDQAPTVQNVQIDTQAIISPEMDISEQRKVATPLTAAPPQPKAAFMSIRAPPGPDPFDDDSDDELLLGDARFAVTPLVARRQRLDFETPVPSRQGSKAPRVSMTALAERFSQWKGATPETTIDDVPISPTGEQSEVDEPQSPPFNLGASPERPLFQVSPRKESMVESPARTSFFEEAFTIREDSVVDSDADTEMYDFDDALFRASQASAASQEYGDENRPLDSALLGSNTTVIQTCTPARVFNSTPRVVHTVTKVPLKPAAEDTPSAKPRQQRRSSLGSLTTPKSDIERRALRELPLPAGTPPASPQSPALTQSPRHNLTSNLLKGAVVYVDVHTLEGADASGIFVELLTQMGARCVKQWTWSPRSSVDDNCSGAAASAGLSARVGITHVVFKDGGTRTMEKIRETGGQVQCVGVNWVLDCERENKWLDETKYAIDAATVPRGGRRRRKSMEPKALLNRPTEASSTTAAAPARPSIDPADFLNLAGSSPPPGGTPTSNRQVLLSPSPRPATPHNTPVACEVPPSGYSTPATHGEGPSLVDSPATPYFLHPQQLVQQTCPPKQTQMSFFTDAAAAHANANGSGDDGSGGGQRVEQKQIGEGVRQRLLLARRKSLQFVPRVGSPLARMI